MQKLFHFDAPREKYKCDAAVVWCFDNRFDAGFRKFLKRIGVYNSDPIKIAGGAKLLASPDHEGDREFVVEQIKKSIRLHGANPRGPDAALRLRGVRRISGRLRRRCERGAGTHRREMERAKSSLSTAIPGLQVEGYFVDFEGVWSTAASDVCAPAVDR